LPSRFVFTFSASFADVFVLVSVSVFLFCFQFFCIICSTLAFAFAFAFAKAFVFIFAFAFVSSLALDSVSPNVRFPGTLAFPNLRLRHRFHHGFLISQLFSFLHCYLHNLDYTGSTSFPFPFPCALNTSFTAFPAPNCYRSSA
jgi:hypothetical protein